MRINQGSSSVAVEVDKAIYLSFTMPSWGSCGQCVDSGCGAAAEVYQECSVQGKNRLRPPLVPVDVES